MKQGDIIGLGALLALLFAFGNKKTSKQGSASFMYLVAPFVDNGMYSVGVQVSDTWYVIDIPAGTFDTKTMQAGAFTLELTGWGDVGYTLAITDSSGTLVDFFGYTNEGIEVGTSDLVNYFS